MTNLSWLRVGALLTALGAGAAQAQSGGGSLPDCSATQIVGSFVVKASPVGFQAAFTVPDDGGVQLTYALPALPGFDLPPRLVPEVNRTRGVAWAFEGRQLQARFSLEGGLLRRGRSLAADAGPDGADRVYAVITATETLTDSGEDMFDLLAAEFVAGHPLTVAIADATSGEALAERDFAPERFAEAIALGQELLVDLREQEERDECRL